MKLPFHHLPRQDKRYGPLYSSNPTNNQRLELFIDNIEKDLFNPASLVLTWPNISKREQNALKEIKSWKIKQSSYKAKVQDSLY